MKARIKFRKYGALRFIGHLDVMRFFQKVMRRAQIPIAFTGGFSPHMIMSFASPLGIGLTSDGEYFDVELTRAISGEEAVRRMNEECVEGIEVLSFRQIAEEKKMTGMTILAGADYLVSFKKGVPEEGWAERFASFMNQDSIRVIKQTKRSEKEVDIRPMIDRWEIRGEQIFLQLAAGSSENLKPDLVMDTFCRFCGLDPQTVSFAYHRLELYANTGTDGKRILTPLEDLGWEFQTEETEEEESQNKDSSAAKPEESATGGCDETKDIN